MTKVPKSITVEFTARDAAVVGLARWFYVPQNERLRDHLRSLANKLADAMLTDDGSDVRKGPYRVEVTCDEAHALSSAMKQLSHLDAVQGLAKKLYDTIAEQVFAGRVAQAA